MKVWMVTKGHCNVDDDTGYCSDHIPILGIAGNEQAVKSIIEDDLRKEWDKYSKHWESFDKFSSTLADMYDTKEFDVIG